MILAKECSSKQFDTSNKTIKFLLEIGAGTKFNFPKLEEIIPYAGKAILIGATVIEKDPPGKTYAPLINFNQKFPNAIFNT